MKYPDFDRYKAKATAIAERRVGGKLKEVIDEGLLKGCFDKQYKPSVAADCWIDFLVMSNLPENRDQRRMTSNEILTGL